MGNKTLWLCALASLAAATLSAQDIAGDWQGTLKTGSQETRHILRIAKREDGGWNAKIFNIDQTQDWGLGIAVSSFTLRVSDLKLTIDHMRVTYQGKVSADGATIAGTWTQGQSQPLELKRAASGTAWRDPSPHSVRFITVNNNVKLEVLDWGGSGRPLVLLTGQGNTAHIFDKFALKLNASYHVYGITRRGYGASSAPGSACEPDCFGDDVLAVVDALKLNRPVLAGHSIAGEELSSVGSRHPEKVSGLIYLEAGYGYAMPVATTIAGEQKSTGIPVPILAIFAVPHAAPPAISNNPAALRAFEAREEASVGGQAKRFETGLPSARVVRLRHADHYVFLSNEADVLREMNAFLSSLSLL
ncbi:MAG: alpha/beta hydrolase [Acidobacteriia bacterium]|nr:alpha/beta hydrolase [Terriglobia bacterium]